MKRLVVVLVVVTSCGFGLDDGDEGSPPGGSGGAPVRDGRSGDGGFNDGGFNDGGFNDGGFNDAGFGDGSFGNGGSGGDGVSAGADSTGGRIDAGGVASSGSLVEGDPCTAAPDCAPGLYCAPQMTSTTNAVFRCSVCASENQPCGTNGSCIAIVTSTRPTLVCSFGQSGEPCRTGADCRSNNCVASISGGADRSTCR